MKKLFLYISLLISIFTVSYFIASMLYRHSKSKPDREIILTENIIEDNDIEENSMLSDFDDNYSVQSANSYIDNNKQDYYKTKDKYILGIRDGYVIVYFNDLDTVYEFTDIDAGVLELLDKEQYEKIKDNISFNSLEELFDFLESLAS